MFTLFTLAQSANCTTDFIQSIRFRGQYSSFFFAPLLAMMFIYTHIFIIIRRHQTARRTLTQQSTLNGVHQGHSNGSRGHDCRFPDGNSQAGSGGPTCRANSNRWSGHQRVHQLSQQWRVGRNASAGSTNPSNADAADQPNSHIKNVKVRLSKNVESAVLDDQETARPLQSRFYLTMSEKVTSKKTV